MKKIFFILFSIFPFSVHAQFFVNIGAGIATFKQQLQPSNESSHSLHTEVIIPVIKLAGGFESGNVMFEAEMRPTICRKSNSPNNFGGKIGYHINRFYPAIGYYFNYCSSDNPSKNFNGFGYSIEYLLPINEYGDLFIEAIYVNQSFQFTSGFHIPF